VKVSSASRYHKFTEQNQVQYRAYKYLVSSVSNNETVNKN